MKYKCQMVHFDNVNASSGLMLQMWHLKKQKKAPFSLPLKHSLFTSFMCFYNPSFWMFLISVHFTSYFWMANVWLCLCGVVVSLFRVFLSNSVKQQSWSVIIASPVWRLRTVVFLVVSLWLFCHVCTSKPVACLFSWQTMDPFVLSFTHCMMWCCLNLRPNAAALPAGGETTN